MLLCAIPTREGSDAIRTTTTRGHHAARRRGSRVAARGARAADSAAGDRVTPPRMLVNPADAAATQTTLREVTVAARAMGLQIQIFNASTSREISAVFATFARERPDAIFVASDPFFQTRRVQFAALAAHHAIPATYSSRDYPEAGGLMSYGANVTDAWRQTGAYAGRILKGTKPADLPVVQSSKFELVINAEIARMLGLTVPDKLLVAADEVIE